MSAHSIVNDPTLSVQDTFSADNYLIHIVRRAVKNSQNIHVALPGHGHIAILATDGEYFNHADDIESFCKADSSEFKVAILSKNDCKTAGDIGRNIDDLMWLAGFHASAGRLMDGCYRDDVVELMHWPNLTRLPSTPNTMRIASLLSNYPTSITLALRFLKIDKSEAYQFYTAAHCAGLARAVNRTPQEPSLKPHRNQALLSLLLNKIARI